MHSGSTSSDHTDRQHFHFIGNLLKHSSVQNEKTLLLCCNWLHCVHGDEPFSNSIFSISVYGCVGPWSECGFWITNNIWKTFVLLLDGFLQTLHNVRARFPSQLGHWYEESLTDCPLRSRPQNCSQISGICQYFHRHQW